MLKRLFSLLVLVFSVNVSGQDIKSIFDEYISEVVDYNVAPCITEEGYTTEVKVAGYGNSEIDLIVIQQGKLGPEHLTGWWCDRFADAFSRLEYKDRKFSEWFIVSTVNIPLDRGLANINAPQYNPNLPEVVFSTNYTSKYKIPYGYVTITHEEYDEYWDEHQTETVRYSHIPQIAPEGFEYVPIPGAGVNEYYFFK